MVPNPKFRDLVKTLLPNKGTNLVVVRFRLPLRLRYTDKRLWCSIVCLTSDDVICTLQPQGCRSGVRSKAASHILVELGYKSVSDVEGGWTAWAAAGLPSEK